MLTRNDLELFIRPARQEGFWMACGYAAVEASPVEVIRTWVLPTGSDSFRQMANVPMPEDDWGQRAVTDQAQLVTQPFWRRFQTVSAPYLQLALRPIDGVPGLSAICGLLQDDKGQASRDWDRAFGTMLRGSLAQGQLVLRKVEADLRWTRGLALGQIQKEPVWHLGAEEPWAARWTLDPEAAQAARRATELRRLMILGEVTPEQVAEFHDQNRHCGGAVQAPGRDERFDAFLRELFRRGDAPDEQAPLRTATEARRTAQAMEEVLRDLSAADPSP